MSEITAYNPFEAHRLWVLAEHEKNKEIVKWNGKRVLLLLPFLLAGLLFTSGAWVVVVFLAFIPMGIMMGRMDYSRTRMCALIDSHNKIIKEAEIARDSVQAQYDALVLPPTEPDRD